MKRILLALASLAALLALCSCGSKDNVLLIDWIDFIQWDGVSYSVGNETVPAEEIGEKLGEITGNPPCEVTGEDVEDIYKTHDGEAAFLPVGTEVYALRSYPVKERIAALKDGEYILYCYDYSIDASLTEDTASLCDAEQYGEESTITSTLTQKQAQPATTDKPETERSNSSTAESTQGQRLSGDLELSVKNVRTDFSDSAAMSSTFPDLVAVSSYAQLEQYLNEVQGLLYPDASQKLRSELDGYDDAFFTDKQLVLARFYESSGSVSHEVERAICENGKLSIFVRRDSPDVGTCDMAGRHLIIELPAGKFDSMELNVDGKAANHTENIDAPY